MIRFRTLGSIDLRDDPESSPSGRELRGVLAQPKRLALFAYLALARPFGSFRRRDTLVALFWPELDAEQARHALRQAIYVLRRELGSDVLVSRGEDELGVDHSLLWCDAAAFEQALKAGRAAEALELYGGELLPGFFAPGAAPEFDEWLERERAHLRELAARAAWQLVTEEEEHNPGLAVHWARRAVTLALDDEKGLRKLIGLLDRLGDRAGAVRAYEEFAARLVREFDATPSAETKALIAAVRARETGRSLTASAPPGPGVAAQGVPSSAPGPDQAPTAVGAEPSTVLTGPQGSYRVRLASRGVHAAAVGMLITLFTAVVWAFHLWMQEDAAAARRPAAVAVLPFTFRGDSEYAYLRDGLAQLLSASINGTGDLESVDPRAVLRFTRQVTLQDVIEPGRAQAVADHFGADLYLVGGVTAAGGQIRVEASLHDRRRNLRPVARAAVDGQASGVFALADEVTRQLVAGRASTPATRLVSVAALTTHSLTALKSYLEGERHFREARYAPAVDAFRRAVEKDSSFALGFYRLSVAATWGGGSEALADSAAERALQLGERLTNRERLLLSGYLALRRGAALEAERTLGFLSTRYPDDVEAWFQLGEVQFHYGPLRGIPASRSRTAFERVLSVDPDHRGALWHLARVAASERRGPEADSLLSRAIALSPSGDRSPEMRLMRAVVIADRAEQDRVVDELRGAHDFTVWGAAWWTAVYTGDLEAAERLHRLATEPTRSPTGRHAAHVGLAYLAAARGRWASAKAHAGAARAALGGETPNEYAALLAAHPALALSTTELDSVRAEILRFRPPPAPPGWRPSFDDFRTGILAASHAYLLGMLSARIGDSAAVERFAALLGGRGEAPEVASVTRDLARGVQARVRLTLGDTAGAVAILEGSEWNARDEFSARSPFFSRALERYLFAVSLAGVRRYREAIGWYNSFAEGSQYDLVYLAPSHLQRAQIYERLGDSNQAAEHYAQFIQMWKDCDPELRPSVDRARRRLSQLRRGTTN